MRLSSRIPFQPRFSTVRWRTRLVLWLAAAAAGLVIVGFARLADLALETFFRLSSGRPWLPFFLAPVVAMLTVWLTRRHFPGSQGSGIPQVIAAIRNAKDRKPVNGLVSPRIVVGKIFLGTFALLGGFSSGREGPSVQVAASILHYAHRFLPHGRALRPEDLVLAGGAAGIAAAFNTPLAGIVFAVEELGRRLETRTSGVLISTIILAGLTAIALQGNYNYFGHLAVGEATYAISLAVLLIGILCGLVGGIFSRCLLWPQQAPDFFLWRWRNLHPVWFAGSCGLVIALIGWCADGMSYGSGYAVTAKLIHGDLASSWYGAFARYAATIVTYFSGIPGGIFAPALAVGAATGGSLADLTPLGSLANHLQIITLCMTGFLAAVTQAPITSAIIVMEMTDGHGMVISLMAVALIARAASSRLGPELYQQLSHGF